MTDEQLEDIKDVLDRNEDVFSKRKADIGCCNFVEHEIELEESAVPHREGTRRMTPNKSDACRNEIETLLDYDMIEPSKSPWACGVVIAKKKWKRMPFGLCNATATFQRLMAHALTSVTKKNGNLVMCYVDDVVIATPTLEDHIERLDEVFACMKRAGLKCQPSKCEILKDSIKYLGRMVDKQASDQTQTQ